MRNNKIIESLVVMVFVIIFLIPMTNSRSLNLNNTPDVAYSLYDDNLIPVNFSIEIGNNYIDDDNNNWSYYVDNYDWCSGNGTESNPYIIEGIHVTNENQTAHIMIETAKYFIIRNVTVSNYAKPYGHYIYSGIYIGNGQFGLIENCLIVNCSIGISLANGRNSPEDITHTIKITNCRFIGSHNDNATGYGKAIGLHGVSFGDVYNYSNTTIKNVNISHNNIYNYYDGICIWKAEEINIENNTIETSFGYISDTGIYFYKVNDSSIVNNDFYGCDFSGHEYEDPFNSSYSDLRTSFIEDNCYNLTIYGNRYYDLNGNLIGDPSDNISQNNEIIFLLIGLFIGLVVVCVVIGVFMVLNKKKSKI